ncbi:LysM peptidoglycan-binding domain-containing protein [Fodinibius halophilus]|uniref:LysM peptidoglycan-binding domain-containing protein n=1 Tax=Fodinibius halophilus TaxID=1736908 RepID=A0A6M1T1F8_9BACT|nr:LysM peptidoglycan-binding domain-containing protein [Fodinibius halophilus]NGP89326.1 LysM peptidoglycan-binding domain-containing protein [Fodinibius halophilus]
MQKKLHSLFILILIVGVYPGIAQQDTTKIQLEEIDFSPKLLPYDNPMVAEDDEFSTSAEPTKQKLDNFEKDVMRRISDIYRTHVNAVEAQVQDDPLSAEKHIKDALNSLQALLDTYPEVQSNPRFSELYRSVMTEYREFYGIQDSANKVEGEIFAIQKELYSGDDDWMNEEYVLPNNITTPKTEVPLVQNRQVNRHLMYFTLKRPEVMESWLERKEKYFPMMREIFEAEGVPTELTHLAMVESGLNPQARSWASAVGMWQFIRATGSMYGLEVNWWIDERRDPEKATRAAARHLKDLYNIWGDWHLAMANYNISPRGLKRAIRAAGKEDYWAAFPYLPRETQGYVPGFIAATMINMNPTEFGFKEEYKNDEYVYKVHKVAPLMPLDALADAAGISTDKLKEYNPELLRWATPPGNKYPLKLPVGTKERFASNYEDIPKNKRSQNVAMHTVNSGETLGYIAQKYGTSVRALYETNESLSKTIYPGQKIVVPLAPGSNEQIAVNRPTNQPRGKTSTSRKRSKSKAPANSVKFTYEVKSGDTIGHIAEWYDVRAWQIRSWNGTSNVIRAGEDLVIYVPKSKKAYYSQINTMSYSKKQQIEREQQSGKDVTEAYLASADDSGESIQYTVRSNDTLTEIANSFGVSVSQIKRLNGLSNSRIYVGQKLNIKPE